MHYKRHEPFRFQFKEPITATLSFQNREGEISKIGKATIIDVSPNGLKFTSELDLPIKNENLLFFISFILNDKEFSIPGNISWKKIRSDYFLYGYKGKNDEETKKGITKALKEYAKSTN
ncbi:PilZ domain-containing protein [Niallia sp. 03133]|uniref:PilZ domain-containing protein n=1 Tax=Niallia sp. 03133 TaxID=3458060 RepID=UPI0040447961